MTIRITTIQICSLSILNCEDFGVPLRLFCDFLGVFCSIVSISSTVPAQLHRHSFSLFVCQWCLISWQMIWPNLQSQGLGKQIPLAMRLRCECRVLLGNSNISISLTKLLVLPGGSFLLLMVLASHYECWLTSPSTIKDWAPTSSGKETA